ncbi:hypothetical protein CRE_21844 [Caenorhabditis remanei]|uniref:Uncharacterized protein n=1 Tax=Caenorhabditis remanei TaxID=31234 RepID=E3MU85_CAERE|nr:hypothetical protein CRE_21844 [Caenorhabditis remanei]
MSDSNIPEDALLGNTPTAEMPLNISDDEEKRLLDEVHESPPISSPVIVISTDIVNREKNDTPNVNHSVIPQCSPVIPSELTTSKVESNGGEKPKDTILPTKTSHVDMDGPLSRPASGPIALVPGLFTSTSSISDMERVHNTADSELLKKILINQNFIMEEIREMKANFVHREDIPTFVSHTDFDQFVRNTTDLIDSPCSREEWLDLVKLLQPLSSLGGSAETVGGAISTLRELLLNQRRLSKVVSQLQKDVEMKNEIFSATMSKFDTTSNDIKVLYTSLRAYIAMKVSELEKESRLKSLVAQLDKVSRTQSELNSTLAPRLLNNDQDDRVYNETIGSLEGIERSVRQLEKEQHRDRENLRIENMRRQKALTCLFCSGDHFSHQCHKYQTPDSRAESFRIQNRCSKCAKIGCKGLMGECRLYDRLCHQCSQLPKEQRLHHQELCPRTGHKKLRAPESQNRVVPDLTAAPTAQSPAARESGAGTSAQRTKDDHSGVNEEPKELQRARKRSSTASSSHEQESGPAKKHRRRGRRGGNKKITAPQSGKMDGDNSTTD